MEFEFDVDIRSRKNIFREFAFFCGSLFCVWASLQFFLNYHAYSQIAAFKIQKLQTAITNQIGNFWSEKKLQKIYIAHKSHKIEPKNNAKNVIEKIQILPSDNRLVIPRINKNVPLINVPGHQNWYQLEQNIQKGLRNGVVVHPVSHAPSSFGNFFLTGHSSYYQWDPGRYKDVFALLHEVKTGDVIEIYWEGKKYKYKINEKKVVDPTAVEVLRQPVDNSILTLMTCTPIGTNKKRLILVGNLKN